MSYTIIIPVFDEEAVVEETYRRLTRKWTFRVAGKANFQEASQFIIVNVLSLLVSAGVLAFLHDVSHLELWLGKVMATGAAIVVNFTVSRLWVFAGNQKSRGEI